MLDPQSFCKEMPCQARHDKLQANGRHCGLDPQSFCREMPCQARHDKLQANGRHCGLDPQSFCKEMPCQARHDKLQTRHDIKDGLFRQLHKTFEIRGAINIAAVTM